MFWYELISEAGVLQLAQLVPNEVTLYNAVLSKSISARNQMVGIAFFCS